MGRPRKDISDLIGKQYPGSRLTILGYVAKADAHRSALVRCRCECGTKTVTRLSYVLTGHTLSCGCVKHQRYVEHMQLSVKQLPPTLIKQCFLSFVDDKAPKPDLPADQIKAGYYRRTEELKSLPNSIMDVVRNRILAHDDYAAIARDNSLHPAEVAWLAKHIIRPEFEKCRLVLDNIRYAKEGRENELKELQEDKKWRETHRAPFWKQDCEEWLRERELREDRFSSAELHNLGTKASQKARIDLFSLDSAWKWIQEEAPHLKLIPEDQVLVNGFREAGERTFRWRREQRRIHMTMKSAKQARMSDAESALVEYDVAA